MKVAVLFYEYMEKGRLAHDVVVEHVAGALRLAGHRVSYAPVQNDLRRVIDALDRQKPQIVFNICESFGEAKAGEVQVAALLEMLRLPFTGTGVHGMALRHDKSTVKKLLAFHDIRTPQYAIISKDSIELAGKMGFPLFVKPLRGDASIGIGKGSLVKDYNALIRQVNLVHKQVGDSALVEEYIAGREFYVSVIGNDPAEPLPAIELDFSLMPVGSAHYYDRGAKAMPNSVQFKKLREIAALNISDEMRNSISGIAISAVRALQLHDYARVDFRVSSSGIPYVVEVNANPYLKEGDTLALAAQQAGMAYAQLIQFILASAWSRSRYARRNGDLHGESSGDRERPQRTKRR